MSCTTNYVRLFWTCFGVYEKPVFQFYESRDVITKLHDFVGLFSKCISATMVSPLL